MELTLNIYNGKEVEKTYKADTYDMMFGTLEDILALFDGIDFNADNEAGYLSIFSAITGLVPMLKPFLKDIFEGITEEEMRRTKVKEIVPVFINVGKYAFAEVMRSATGKN